MDEQELRDLDLWVAEVAGIDVYPRHTTGELLMRVTYEPWHPHTSFDQAWEHLAPVLLARGYQVSVTQEPEMPIVAWVRDAGVRAYSGVDDTIPALAFCLAAKAALTEKDDG